MMSGIGYGTDTSCGAAGYRSGVLVRGRILLVEAIFRRLTTPRGTLLGGEEEAAYGLDLSGLVGSVDSQLLRASLPSRVRAELLKDDRIREADVSVFVRANEDGMALYDIEIGVTPADGSGTFSMTMRVDQVTATLLRGGSEAVNTAELLSAATGGEA